MLSSPMKSFLLMCAVSSVFQVQAENGCKVLDFSGCEPNKSLVDPGNETFRVIAPGLEDCQHKCFIAHKCVSYNLGPVQGMMRTCELNRFDHVTLPNKVVAKNGFEYCAIKNNPCKSHSCPYGKLCIPDFAWGTATCVDGVWSEWNEWGTCTCPSSRSRTCQNPSTGAVGSDCAGPKEEQAECRALSQITGCDAPLGMEDGNITDAQITASSEYGSFHCKPDKARLNLEWPIYSSWCARSKRAREYLQVDLRSPKKITRIATQARHVSPQWVTLYTLAYSTDGSIWVEYTGGKMCTKEFVGNTDGVSIVTHDLPVAITARYIRIVVLKWSGHPSIRIELYGCNNAYNQSSRL